MPSAATPITDEIAGPRITWFGHATAVAELGKARILFDPLLRGRTRRAGRVDAVAITHTHVDHLNRWSLKAVDRDTILIVPRGSKSIVADLGFRQVIEVVQGDQIDINGTCVEAVPTKHDPGRWTKTPLPDALGYVVSGGGATVHHAGDVDFSDHSIFDDIGKRFAIDAALLPIGGMMPVWWYRMRKRHHDRGVHIDPDCAVDIYERLGARSLIPIHWGTLHLRLGLPSMPRRRLAKVVDARNAGGVSILAHGEQLQIQPR
ncbi:MAG: MBL fold metallo-hydrolase [Proteobacteria bacterium]|nr:MBL fold metallo-hydrolase [Pseudomonadota bacterium]